MNQITKDLKDAIRHPFCFPGGYAKIGIMSDGAVICTKCMKSEFKEILRATRDRYSRTGWELAAIEIYWEGPINYCCHCNEEIPSEYGDPDAENN